MRRIHPSGIIFTATLRSYAGWTKEGSSVPSLNPNSKQWFTTVTRTTHYAMLARHTSRELSDLHGFMVLFVAYSALPGPCRY